MASYDELIAKSKELAAAGDTENAKKVAEIALKSRGTQPPKTNVIEQAGNGVNEGLAGILGFPVDAVTSAINGVAGKELISNPVGGSESFGKLLSPFITDAEPQTKAQRYARRIGEDVGASAIPAGIAMKGMKAGQAGTLAIMEALSSGVSGSAAQSVEDAGGGALAQTLASMGASSAPFAISKALRKGPKVKTVDDVRAEQSSAYDYVDNSEARLSKQQRDDLILALEGRTKADSIDEILHPKANRMIARTDALPENPTIADVERIRRIVGRDVAGSSDAGEAAIGVGMKQEIDDYLKGLSEDTGQSEAISKTLSEVQRGRTATARLKKHETLTDAIGRGERRAASSGTGGNEVNAIRQNIRSILDSPKKRRGFSESELKAMEDIVRGNPSVNAARLLGKLSPNSGAIPLTANIGAVSAGGVSGDPVTLAMSVAPGVIGGGAKYYAESATTKQVDDLLKALLNGGEVKPKTLSDLERRGIIAALTGDLTSAQ